MVVTNFKNRFGTALTTLAISFFLMPPHLCCAEMYFPPGLISADPDSIADLSYLSPAGSQLPGEYNVEIFLNDVWAVSRRVKFVAADGDAVIHDQTGLLACLSLDEWQELGLKVSAIPALAALSEVSCVVPGNSIPHAGMSFDFQNMRLNIAIPQAMLKNRPQGWIPPERWDEGVPALISGYRLNGSRSQSENSDSNNLFLSLENGINAGSWRLRDSRTWSHNVTRGSKNQGKWERLETYASRAIIPWRSELLLGESATDSDLFEAFAFQGVKLETDDGMYPDTLRGYAPLIKGVAFSNARVNIRQSGNLIYQTFVPPGAFEIDDLYPVSAGGDLDVTVMEADGTSRNFTVPYSSVPLLQREGRIRYSVAAGRFRSNSDSYENPGFAQGTVQWGLPHNATLYGGAQMAEKYSAAMLGAGVNMGSWGALSADITDASSTLADGSHHRGQSVRFLYAHSMSALGTTFRLAGYRYSTKGFHTLDETALKGMSGWLYDDNAVDSQGRPIERPYTDYYNLYNAKRTRIQANISQTLNGHGSLYLTGSRQTWWNSARSTDSLMAGYSGRLGPVSYNLSWNYSKNNRQTHADRVGYLSFSLPFSALQQNDSNSRWATSRLSGNVNRDSNGRQNYTTGLGGTAFADDSMNWNIQQGYARQGNRGGNSGNSGSASVNYRGTYGSASLGYSYSKDYRQVNYGVSGGAVVHPNGVTFGRQPGETNVLVAAPGATGVPVRNSIGVQTDWRGYALLPYSMEYRENTISLNTEQLSEDTEFENTVTRVVPTRRALVRADFKAHSGLRALITLSRKGKPLPFGATVTSANSSGIVGDDGLVYLTGLEKKGALKVQWGSEAEKQCTVHYSLTDQQIKKLPVQVSEICLPE